MTIGAFLFPAGLFLFG
jgi:glucose uptake protein GlcU